MDDEKILQITDDQLNFLDRMSALHQQRMADSIRELEKRIVDRLTTLQTSDSGNLLGVKTNLAQAQKVHSDLSTLFDEEYGAAAKETVKEYSESLPIIQQQFKEMGEAIKYTGVDRAMVNALKGQDLAAYSQFGVAAQDKIAKALYDHVVSQSSFSALASTIAGALTGQKDARGRPLSNYAKQMANDGIMNFHNAVNLKKAEDAGFTHFLYVGNIIADSRDFCVKRAGNVYTKEQINSWTGPWKGKSGPAMTHRGGYNCRHHWQPVRKEWIPEGGIEVQSWFDRAGVMPMSKLPTAITGNPKFKAYQAWQKSLLVDKKPLTSSEIAKVAEVNKSAASGWLSQWGRGYNLPQGWQSVVRDLEAQVGGFERSVVRAAETAASKPSVSSIFDSKLFQDLFSSDFSELSKHPVWGKLNAAGPEDSVLSELYNLVGLNARPTLLPADKFALAEGRALARGISASSATELKTFVDQFLTSDRHFAGKGVWGNGTYTAYGSDALEEATKYSKLKSDGTVFEMKLKPGARVISHQELAKLESEFIRDHSGRIELEKLKDEIFSMPKGDLKDEAKEKYIEMLRDVENKERKLKMVVQDPGRLAALLGYDAIDVANNSYMVVLNRGMLFVKQG